MLRMLKKNDNTYVSINFLPDCLTLCVIHTRASRSANHHFKLKALTHIPLARNEYHEGRMYNPTIIGHSIVQFLSTHNVQKNPLAFTINGSLVAQQFSIQADSFYAQSRLNNPEHLIESCALYQEKDDLHMYYTCTVERSTVMQYQLMAIAHTFNLQALSTTPMAHLNLHRYVSKKTPIYAHELENLLKKNNYDTNHLIDKNTIDTIIQIPASIEKSPQNYDEISIALGAIIPFIPA